MSRSAAAVTRQYVSVPALAGLGRGRQPAWALVPGPTERRRPARRAAGAGRGRSSRGTRPVRGRRRRGLGPDGATDEDAARAGAAGGLDLGLERRARRPRPTGAPTARADAASSSAQASRQRARSVTAASYGNSALRMSPPIAVSRRAVSMTTRRRASPVERLAVDERERERLDEQREVHRPARGGDLGDEALLVCGVRGVGVVVDEELGGRRAHPLRLSRRSSRRGRG